MGPPKMDATMVISEEWMKQEREASKAIEEKADEYHEHLDYEH